MRRRDEVKRKAEKEQKLQTVKNKNKNCDSSFGIPSKLR